MRPPGLDRVAGAQHGVFTRTQALRDGGMALDAVKSRVRRGTWRRIYSGVYTDVPGPLERPGQLWAAVLYAGRGAVISHETAAELHGLMDGESPLVHIAIPAGRQVVPAAGLRVHRLTRVYDPPDGHRDPPRSTIEDTLLDLVQVASTFDEARGWISRGFGRELTSELRLRHAMSQRAKVRWRAELTDVIDCGQPADGGSWRPHPRARRLIGETFRSGVANPPEARGLLPQRGKLPRSRRST